MDVFNDSAVPSWEYFAEAAMEPMPSYFIERSKSSRRKCKQHGKNAASCNDGSGFIDQNGLCVGTLDKDLGSYVRFVHLNCWRVPNRIWKKLPDPEEIEDQTKFKRALLSMRDTLIGGLQELDKKGQQEVVAYCMQLANYAKSTKAQAGAKGYGEYDEAFVESKLQALAQAGAGRGGSGGGKFHVQDTAGGKPREIFVAPVPGQNGVLSNALAGKTIVLAGLFPEVGGGAGLRLGQERVKTMIESFGGRVTKSVSGKTDILIVGKEPDYTLVTDAQNRSTAMMSLKDLKEGIEGNCIEERAKNPTNLVITNFSAGYGGNSAAPDYLQATKKPPPLASIGHNFSTAGNSAAHAYLRAMKPLESRGDVDGGGDDAIGDETDELLMVVDSMEASPAAKKRKKNNSNLKGVAATGEKEVIYID